MPEVGPRRITIVGLGYTGRCLGLALRAALPTAEVAGHDRDADAAKEASRTGAVHSTHWNLIRACEHAEVIFLAMRPSEVIATLQALAPETPDGVVLSDAAALKAPVLAWARSGLRQGLHYVGGHPLLRRGPSPSAAALTGASYCLTPPAETEPGAVSLVASLVSRMGAHPVFLDATEHDGIMTVLQQGPALAAATALAVAKSGEARDDLRALRAAVPDEAVALAARSALAGVTLTAANRDSLRLELDRLIALLGELRAAIDDESGEPLARTLQSLDDAAQFWENGAPVSQPEAPTEAPRAGSSWRRMLGLR